MGLFAGLVHLLRSGGSRGAAEPSPLARFGKARLLQDWRPSLPHEAVEYTALWRDATSPTHPILRDRVRSRLADGEQARMRQGEGDLARAAALGPDAAAGLLAEAFARVPFLVRLTGFLRERPGAGFDPAVFGTASAVSNLADDMARFGEASLARADALNDGQVEQLGWAVGHLGEHVSLFPDTIANALARLSPLLLGNPGRPLSAARRGALERLYRRLDGGARATVKPQDHWRFLADLAERLGHSMDDSAYFAAMRTVARAASHARMEIEAVAGPEAGPVVAALYAGTDGVVRHVRPDAARPPEFEAFEALTPERRGAGIAGCLRVARVCERQDTDRYRKQARPTPYFGDKPVELYISEAEAGADSRPGRLAAVMRELFEHFIVRKVAFSDADLADIAGLMLGEPCPVRTSARTLHVVKHIERHLARGADPILVERAEAVLAALRADSSYHDKAFRRAAVPRLARALEDAGSIGSAEDGPSKPTGMAGFVSGQREEMPSSGTALEPPAYERLSRDYVPAVRAFYDDFFDLRKLAPGHVAFLDRLIADDTLPSAPSAPCPHPWGTPEWLAHMTEAGRYYRSPGMYASTLTALRARIVLLRALPAERRAAFLRLGREAHLLEGRSSPSGKWLRTVRPALDGLAEADRLGLLATLLDAYEPPTESSLFDNTLRGLIYLSAAWPAEKVGPLLVAYARRKCFQTVPGQGIRSERQGTACLWSLIHLPDGAGVPFLARLQQRVKYPSVRKRIDAALNEAARTAGLSRAALDELSVPTHDLVDGARTLAVGAGEALLRIAGTASVELRWRTPEGRETASVPAALKIDRAGIKAARDAAREIEADLSTQVARLQRLFLEDRSWSLADWRARYAGHPLMGGLACRLIWNVVENGARVSASLLDGALVDLEGRPIAAGEGARIALWHPIGCPVAETLAWRARLAMLETVQPFKQAHREIYVVTDAERATGTYSNRFAGHILRQHQMMSLARLNGWTVTHRIWADVPNDEPTHRVLAEHGLVAEFWTAGAGGENPEVTPSQAYAYLSTDQVRFHRIADPSELARPTGAHGPRRGEPVAMAEVPPLVFSEVMRTCDLFAGVASVANDPEWINGGADAQHPNQWRRTVGEDYWRTQSVSQLSEIAKARAETLAAIVPAFAIADRLSLDGRFLTVRGQLRSYRIHIGSGNILMTPDDRYLCIVKGADAPPGTVATLPFEGDALLSLILSKAFLLAADDTITDPSIVAQIRTAA